MNLILIEKILLYLFGIFVIIISILLLIMDFDKMSGHPYGFPMIMGMMLGFGFGIIWGGYNL